MMVVLLFFYSRASCLSHFVTGEADSSVSLGCHPGGLKPHCFRHTVNLKQNFFDFCPKELTAFLRTLWVLPRTQLMHTVPCERSDCGLHKLIFLVCQRVNTFPHSCCHISVQPSLAGSRGGWGLAFVGPRNMLCLH